MTHNDPAGPFGFVPIGPDHSRAYAAYQRAEREVSSASFRLALDAVADDRSSADNKRRFLVARAAEEYASGVHLQACDRHSESQR